MSEEAFMKTMIHLNRHEDSYFHLHPLHAMISLIASFLVAVLIVLVLVSSAR
jgi:hypothetical protein